MNLPMVKRFVDLKIGDSFKYGNFFGIKTTNYNDGMSNMIYYNSFNKIWKAFNLKPDTMVIFLGGWIAHDDC